MPTNRKPLLRQRRTSSSIPPGLWRWLIDEPWDPGVDNTGRLETFTHDRGELWLAYRGIVLSWWALRYPGTRPSLWWQYEAPEPRRKRESELDYLRRHRLLLPGEMVDA
jgi:hypothetical protein